MTKEEKIVQAFKDMQEEKHLLDLTYREKFDTLPVSPCGEVSADAVLALNAWVDSEAKRILNTWANKVVHA